METGNDRDQHNRKNRSVDALLRKRSAHLIPAKMARVGDCGIRSPGLPMYVSGGECVELQTSYPERLRETEFRYVICLLRRRGEGTAEIRLLQRHAGQEVQPVGTETGRFGDTMLAIGELDVDSRPQEVIVSLRVEGTDAELLGVFWGTAHGAYHARKAAHRQRFAPPSVRFGRMILRALPRRARRSASRFAPESWRRAAYLAYGWEGDDGTGFYARYRKQMIEVVKHRPPENEKHREPSEPAHDAVRLAAYYLPQFHPIPENDRWWGKGFTEWRNVTRGIPAYSGHYQPRLPADLGFYDLRTPETIASQAALAKRYGLSAFCFHFYWFGGKRLLERPLLTYREHADVDLPYFLCWANENWTRRWDGADQELLIGQAHSRDDDIAFIRYLEKYFEDDRYVRVDGKPVLIVYRPGILPDGKATIERWREEAHRMGLPGLYLVATNSFDFSDYESMGFDAITEFPPHAVRTPSVHHDLQFYDVDFAGQVLSYADVVRSIPPISRTDAKVWPGVMPGWDNSARRPTEARIFHGSTPELFEEWLSIAIARARRNPPGERFVMINAWNEWAEGAHLEPDLRHGHAYLEACARALHAAQAAPGTIGLKKGAQG